jgi:hypothetical protein
MRRSLSTFVTVLLAVSCASQSSKPVSTRTARRAGELPSRAAAARLRTDPAAARKAFSAGNPPSQAGFTFLDFVWSMKRAHRIRQNVLLPTAGDKEEGSR